MTRPANGCPGSPSLRPIPRPATATETAWDIAAVLSAPSVSAWAWHRRGGTGLSPEHDPARTDDAGRTSLACRLDRGGRGLAAGDVVTCGALVDAAYGIDAAERAVLSAWWRRSTSGSLRAHTDSVLVVASDAHRAHVALELDDGAMGPSIESPDAPTSSPAHSAPAGHEFIGPDAVDLALLRRVHDPDYVDFLATAWDRWVAEGKTAPAAMGFMWPTRGFPGAGPTTSSGHSATTASRPTPRSSPARIARRSPPRRSRRPPPTAWSRRVTTTYGLCRPGTPRDGRPVRRVLLLQQCSVSPHSGCGTAARNGWGSSTSTITTATGPSRSSSIVATSCSSRSMLIPARSSRGSPGSPTSAVSATATGRTSTSPSRRGDGGCVVCRARHRRSTFSGERALDALVVSLGVDAYEHDPLGTFALTTADFATSAARIRSLGLATVIVQEGGYAVGGTGRKCRFVPRCLGVKSSLTLQQWECENDTSETCESAGARRSGHPDAGRSAPAHAAVRSPTSPRSVSSGRTRRTPTAVHRVTARTARAAWGRDGSTSPAASVELTDGTTVIADDDYLLRAILEPEAAGGRRIRHPDADQRAERSRGRDHRPVHQRAVEQRLLTSWRPWFSASRVRTGLLLRRRR